MLLAHLVIEKKTSHHSSCSLVSFSRRAKWIHRWNRRKYGIWASSNSSKNWAMQSIDWKYSEMITVDYGVHIDCLMTLRFNKCCYYFNEQSTLWFRDPAWDYRKIIGDYGSDFVVGIVCSVVPSLPYFRRYRLGIYCQPDTSAPRRVRRMTTRLCELDGLLVD